MGTVFLTREEIMLAIPVSSPLSLHKEAELELLGREPIVMPTEDQLLREQIERLCTASGFKLEVDFECDSPFLVRMLVQRGLGITFWPVQTWRVYSSDSLTRRWSGSCGTWCGISPRFRRHPPEKRRCPDPQPAEGGRPGHL